MNLEALVQHLDHPEESAEWFRSLGVTNVERAYSNLAGMAEVGITLDLLAVITARLEEHLGNTSDPDMALNNLERFVRASRNPLALGSLIERDREALPILLQLFSSSQYLSDIMINEPESYDLLRLTEGAPVARDILVDEFCAEIDSIKDERAIMKMLRQYKRRETLRIAYGDFVRGHRIDTVTRQISYLADAICQAALSASMARRTEQFGTPRTPSGRESRFVVFALGKLGGAELNYSSDIDLMFLYEEDGQTDGAKPTSNREFFDHVARGVVKLLSEQTDWGAPYRVDLRLRPEGRQGPMVIGLQAALRYYDVTGRTWERQAFVKARPCAGDLEFGEEFLAELEPWIYRRYLSRADITGIKALKRRIEKRTLRDGADLRNVKTGRGGIRDIEFVIQFLQLLNGGDLPSIRTGNTLEAITRLEEAGCLTLQERNMLEDNYVFLRRIEHRLQIMFDLQTHALSEDDAELRKLAVRMGYVSTPHIDVLRAFKNDFQEKTHQNRKVLDRLLHDAFADDSDTDPVVDLVLDPEPSRESIHSILGKYGFRDTASSYDNLNALARERIRFLSTRRCRHFLAAIAPQLLSAIAETPDPDVALVNLSQVSDSLAGKGVLWELFSYSEASLRLYVRLCATSPYLTGILTSNPGMIDELMDSLVLDRLPTRQSARRMLADLCRGAEDIDPILHGFKNSLHLRVGVRDILGKDDIRATTAALSDIAEVCLQEITLREYHRLVQKFGQPSREKDSEPSRSLPPVESSVSSATATSGDRLPGNGNGCELIILGMGKLGGREPNYHSDLDIVLLYECDGLTRHRGRSARGKTTTNQHFFSELGQRVIKVMNHLGPQGRLYELDPRLRPTGKSGMLAVSIDEFSRYFSEGHAQLWERQALCRARPIFGSAEIRQEVMRRVRQAIVQSQWNPQNAQEILEMRRRLEETASSNNLKRGPGGTVDVEFVVQMLQMKHAVESPEVLTPGTLDALAALQETGHLSQEDARFFAESYRFLRSIEARLRLMNTTARHDLPSSKADLEKLAYLLGLPNSDSFLEGCRRYTTENRTRFQRLFSSAIHNS